MKLKTYVLSIGIVNIQTGKTQYDWSIYDSNASKIFLTSGSFLLYASPTTFNIGDECILIGNDSNRKLGKTATIIASCDANRDDVVKMLFDNGYDYRVLRAFAKKKFDRKLITSYSVKGTEEII